MSTKALQISITGAAVLLALIHLAWPTLSVDAVVLTLLIVAIAPWLAPLLKSLELPGGLKIEFQELQRTSDKAEKAGLLPPAAAPTGKKPQYSFELVAGEDPNLALAGLRIEIERRLRELADTHNVEGKRTVTVLLRSLSEAGALTEEERSVLADMVGLLNSAAHGVAVDKQGAAWAIEIGPRLLDGLERRASREALA